MNRALVEPIADAVLYEGYILYPYRPSVKNRQRWTFGGLYPEAYCQATGAGDASCQQTECLIQGSAATRFEAVIRFLHLTARQVGELVGPLADWPGGGVPPFRPVAMLQAGDEILHTWQEAEEREISFAETTLGDLLAEPRVVRFTCPGGQRWEPVRGPTGTAVGVLVREQQMIEADVEAGAVEAARGTLPPHAPRRQSHAAGRGPAAGAATRPCSALSSRRTRSSACETARSSRSWTRPIAGARPPPLAATSAPGRSWWARRDRTIRCSPRRSSSTTIRSVAPESPGDFFDGTEIDEMLTLRIMTMTDEEKHEMAAVDPRTAELLTRTETMAREQLLGLHGTVRGLRTLPEEGSHG